MIEKVHGPVTSDALIRWAPRMPQLKILSPYNGNALGDQLAQSMMHTHCPNLEEICLYYWIDPDADHNLATFLSGMKKDTLRSFEVISQALIGAETFLACNHHAHTLKDLRLSLRTEALSHLALLKDCTVLESLQLTDVEGVTDLESTQNDVFQEVIRWLRECQNLRSLSLNKFLSAAAIATPVLQDGGIKLERLEIDCLNVRDHRNFHHALKGQVCLRPLR